MSRNRLYSIPLSLLLLSPSAMAATERPLQPHNYVRIDLGSAIHTKISGSFTGEEKGTERAKMKGNAPVVALGIGRQFNPFLRADLTLNHTPKYLFVAKREGPSWYSLEKPFQYSYVLVNGYVDVVNAKNFTPYLTAGIGRGRVKSGKTTFVNHDVDVNNLPHNYGTTVKGRTTHNTVFQLGGGVAYHLTHALGIDLAYRYVHLGKVKDGAQVRRGINDTVATITPYHTKLRSNIVTIGARYNF